MKLPVSREAYDERGRTLTDMRALRDRLLDTIDELRTELARMRRDGFQAARPAIVHQAPDEDKVALGVAEQQLIQRRDDAAFIDRAIRDMKAKNPGITDAAARAEAIKLRRAVTDEDPPS